MKTLLGWPEVHDFHGFGAPMHLDAQTMSAVNVTVTAILGGIFLCVQGYEWVQLVHFGLTMSSSTYGTTFYTLIGTHALHVAGALIWLLAVLGLTAAGRVSRERGTIVRGCALYWHFVVGLWPILFVTVYLL